MAASFEETNGGLSFMKAVLLFLFVIIRGFTKPRRQRQRQRY